MSTSDPEMQPLHEEAHSDVEEHPTLADSSGTGQSKDNASNSYSSPEKDVSGSKAHVGGRSHVRLSRKKTFGIRKTAQPAFAHVAATYDYTVKYKEDPLFHELDENARVWHVYNDETREFDADMVEEASDSLDILLIFAGLFSAVLTTFLVQTYQSLSPDNVAITASLLKELVELQRAQAKGVSFDSVASTPTFSPPSAADRWVNGLWFTSLTLSLSDALIAVLAKQWLRQYHSRLSGSPRDRAILRQFRYDGFENWGVRSMIGFLPMILHISVILFLIGLVLLLWSLDKAMAAVTGGITGVLLSIYVLTNLLPLILIQCPLRTPLTNPLHRLFNRNPLRLLPRRLLRSLPRSWTERSHERYKDLTHWETKAANSWMTSGSGMPGTLKTLLNITTNASVERVVADSVVSLTSKDGRLVNGPHKLAYETFFNVFRRSFYQSVDGLIFSLSRNPSPNLSDLAEEDKIKIQRAMLGSLRFGRTWLWSLKSGCCVLASDLSLALIAMAAHKDLRLSIVGDKHLPIEPTQLQCKDAFAWVVQRNESLEIPALPIIVWQVLWYEGGWNFARFKQAAWSDEGKRLISQVKSRTGPAEFGREPLTLLEFLNDQYSSHVVHTAASTVRGLPATSRISADLMSL